ncbi:probable RNA-binding protein EIF1AD [Sitodiplosis mosellana]|uniref:probable RNA-binding protein EIF1AD n=1 Tax=Sitodiplosis mosellana TaxID=263140 RepID=UPI002443A57F|nr:probable RNA-binding protein EIF1AD [Sitodiplosis mosellana]
MSKVTKRKHVMKEMQTDDFDPPGPNQQIVRILGSRGNNLHEVESAEPIPNNGNATNDDAAETNTDRFLISMPTKFRKNVWVKRGDYVIVEPIDEGDKVKAEIVRILTPQHIKEFTKDGIWPEKFTTKNDDSEVRSEAVNSSEDDDDDLFRNTNRSHQHIESDEEESSGDETSSEEESD